ncbi:MAG: archaellin/type IV pilin N-terminal domain-containing protein [Halobacteriota archaeon]
MAVIDRVPLLRDERGVSVVFGTLLLILITIIAASGVAVMVSTTQKDIMERQAQIEAVENENLKVISIHPIGNSTHWNSVNITALNLNTDDAYITGIKMNDIFALNYMAGDERGNIDYYKDYPMIYNFNRRILVPATKSKEISLNFTNITVTETRNFDVSGWPDEDEDYVYSMPSHPGQAYSEVTFSEEVSNSSQTFTIGVDYTMDYDSGKITLYKSGDMNPHLTKEIDVSGWGDSSSDYNVSLTDLPIMTGSETVWNTSTDFISTNNYTMDYTAGNITLLGSGNMDNTSNYNISFKTNDNVYNITYTIDAESFTKPISIEKGDTIVLELMTSHINIFKETFIPPIPLAEVQFENEQLKGANGTEYQDYLILDASGSFDQDGFITAYRWAIWDNSTMVYDYNLTGMKVRPTQLDLGTASNIEIDLEVVDDNGMISRLSQRSGNITIL